jgi:hypothetical protein
MASFFISKLISFFIVGMLIIGVIPFSGTFVVHGSTDEFEDNSARGKLKRDCPRTLF